MLPCFSVFHYISRLRGRKTGIISPKLIAWKIRRRWLIYFFYSTLVVLYTHLPYTHRVFIHTYSPTRRHLYFLYLLHSLLQIISVHSEIKISKIGDTVNESIYLCRPHPLLPEKELYRRFKRLYYEPESLYAPEIHCSTN